MTRYATRGVIRTDDDDVPEDFHPLRTIVVIEPADDFIDTGLLDASGDAIVRMREPIGFVT